MMSAFAWVSLVGAPLEDRMARLNLIGDDGSRSALP